nr:MAG TPA: SAGA-associated factor 73-FINGER, DEUBIQUITINATION, TRANSCRIPTION FACTOR, SAGA [Caudoviricetes sp.]
MIFKFIKRLFCWHEWEHEESDWLGEPYKVCRKCGKEKEIEQ